MATAEEPRAGPVTGALRLEVRGVVQGVGFRPFVHGLAHRLGLTGWVANDGRGVAIHVQGPPDALRRFETALRSDAPPAARIADLEVRPAPPERGTTFELRESGGPGRPTARITPDLPVCDACLEELFSPGDRRRGYPYITCTACGPRFSLVLDLPYDRERTTMRAWPPCPACAREYGDPADRRFHAQPVACPACGPGYHLRVDGRTAASGPGAVESGAALLARGGVVAVKGLGGYHLACDARNEAAVTALRERKFRKEKPFALMARTLEEAREVVELDPASAELLTGWRRPIVLAPARTSPPGVAPGGPDLGVMLPYAPVHHLLFAAGAPPLLVMTSANRSSEPIAYLDEDARDRLAGLADALLVGERPIARRVDDSVVRVGPFGPVVVRRARGFAPEAVTRLPVDRPVLAVGGDLKGAVALVVDGQAFVSQHLGDLEHHGAATAFRETVADLLRMYRLEEEDLVVAHDLHPAYASTRYALGLSGEARPVQHHRAHVASVLAEREAWDAVVVGAAFDGTGYGDDGTVWGGEIFVGSVREGFRREAWLRPAALPGGDAAARHPVQAAAGFLADMDGLPDLTAEPFDFPARYGTAVELVRTGVRTFTTTSVGRLFDTVAALLGFTRAITFEGQAAVWVEHLARRSGPVEPYPFPGLDHGPLLRAVAADRAAGRALPEIARAFHAGLAEALLGVAGPLAERHCAEALVLSGGVFQNTLLLAELRRRHEAAGAGLPALWTNRAVPPGDGGLSLGQAALAALGPRAPRPIEAEGGPDALVGRPR